MVEVSETARFLRSATPRSLVILDEIAASTPAPSAGSTPAQTGTLDGAATQIVTGLVGRTVADVERDLILETLKHCLGNRTHAANILGISIRTLRNKLNEYADGGLPITPAGAGDYHRVAASA